MHTCNKMGEALSGPLENENKRLADSIYMTLTEGTELLYGIRNQDYSSYRRTPSLALFPLFTLRQGLITKLLRSALNSLCSPRKLWIYDRPTSASQVVAALGLALTLHCWWMIDTWGICPFVNHLLKTGSSSCSGCTASPPPPGWLRLQVCTYLAADL